MRFNFTPNYHAAQYSLLNVPCIRQARYTDFCNKTRGMQWTNSAFEHSIRFCIGQHTDKKPRAPTIWVDNASWNTASLFSGIVMRIALDRRSLGAIFLFLGFICAKRRKDS
jgi:hypothetical protein